MNSWIAFSVIAPLCWGFGNVLDAALRKKFIQSDTALTWFLAVTRLPLIIIFLAIYGVEIPSIPTAFWIIIGGILWMCPFVWYYMAIKFEEPSRVILLNQMVNIATFVAAFFMINERLNGAEFAAFAALLAGGILAAFKRISGRWHFSRAFWLIMLASIFWSLSDVIFKKYAVEFSGFAPAFSLYLLGSFLPALFALPLKKQRTGLFAHFKTLSPHGWRLLILNQIISLIGTAAFAYALTLGKASLTTVILGTQPLFAILWGFVLAKFIREVEPEDFRAENLILKAGSFALIIAGLSLL